MSESTEPSELGELDDLHSQGFLTDDEHEQARDRLGAGGAGGGRRGMGRAFAFWPVAALLVGVGLIVFAILGTGGSSKPKTEPGIEVHGAVVIALSEASAVPDDTTVPPGAKFNVTSPGFGVGKGCHTTSGLTDITTGAAVQISSGNGTKLASTTLKAGVYDTNADCIFAFTVAVPKESSYSIRIAQRNPVQYAQSEIAAPQLNL